MIINVKKAQVDTVKLQRETEENKKAVERGEVIGEGKIALAYLSLATEYIKKSDPDIIREQVETFNSDSISTGGFFGKLGSKADSTVAKIGKGIADKIEEIGLGWEHAITIVATVGDDSIMARTGNMPKLEDELGRLAEVSSECKASMEALAEISKNEGLQFWVYVSDTETDYDIIRDCYTKPDTQTSKFALAAIERVLSNTLRVINSINDYAEVDGFKLFQYKSHDVIALNLIKIVKKSTDASENDFVGENLTVVVEALALSDTNKTRIIRSVDIIGEDSTIRIASNDLKSMKAISLEEVRVWERQGEAFDKVNSDCKKLTSFEKEQVAEAEDIIYEASTMVYDNMMDKDFLAVLLVPVNHDLSNSFKAKYI